MSVPSKFREWIPRQHMSGLQLVGQGGFGTIYRARHKDWGIDVAVKILSRDSTCTRKELLAEARAMEVARFPFILRLFGLYAEELEEAGLGDQSLIPRGLGIVMEFMERGSLLSLLRQVRHVPWALRFRILHQVGLGMNYLHGLNPPLLHLDLKPSNILLNGELHVRLADFGLSKFKRGMTQQDAASSKEQVYEHGGTLEYMPPEAFTDINYKPATATDVYSYGILTWSVLAGEEPYANLHAEMLSTMLRIHIPLGQRPSTEELEKVTNVQGLDNMIKLMKSCWDTEKTCRPSFQECRTETEEIFLLHESYVGVIVLEVLRHLTGSASDKSSTSGMSSAPPGSIRSAPYSSSRESLGISECFKTLHLKEPPSYQNEAVPIGIERKKQLKQKTWPPIFSRSTSLGPARREESPSHEHASSAKGAQPRLKPPGNMPRPLSDSTLPPVNLSSPWLPAFLPIQQQPAASHRIQGNIYITHCSGVQAGNNNVMYIKYKKKK